MKKFVLAFAVVAVSSTASAALPAGVTSIAAPVTAAVLVTGAAIAVGGHGGGNNTTGTR